MFYSIDTNIVIGLVNPCDRLHDTAVSLINKTEGNWVITHEVIAETRETLKKKINEAFSCIVPILIEIYKNTPDLKDLIEIRTKLIEAFKQLEKENPNLTNVYKLIHQKIEDYLSKTGHLDIDVFPYLSELGDNMSRTVEPELKKYIVYKKLTLDLRKSSHKNVFEDIKSTIARIRFKDSRDENIFFELMVNLREYNPLKFFTDDKEFIKKGRTAYALLSSTSLFDPNWFLMEEIG